MQAPALQQLRRPGTPCGGQQRPCARPAGLGGRRRLAVAADANARVRGDPRRVCRYLSDMRHWSSFYPGTKSAVKLGNGQEPIRLGSKFETTREMLGLKLPMTYEVLQLEPGKRLVLSGLSEHHTQMDQFFFMADRHDAGFTAVRYITDVRLREWRAYLQPLASRFQSRVPEEALTSLARTLNSAQSPLFAPDFEAGYRQELRSSGSGGGSRSGGSSAASSRGGTASSSGRGGARGGGGGGRSSISGGWLRDLITGSRSLDEGDASSGRRSSSSGSGDSLVLDPMGYYDVLGLEPHSQLDDEAIKAAYRRLALQLHPDRQAGKGAAERDAVAARFALLLKAYDTLKDPQQRALYDAGQLIEASLRL